MWETTTEGAVNNFHNDLDDPTIVERVFNLGTPQAPLVTLVRPLSPEPILVPPCGVPIIVMQTIPRSSSLLPIYIRNETPPPPPTPSSGYEDLPGAPQIRERPGDDWHHNHDGEGIMFAVLIPNGDEGQQIAPFIHIITNEGDPQLEATMGWGCPITQLPLHACPDPYPQPMLTDTQMEVFRASRLHTPLVNQALAEDLDPFLQAEVYHYQAQQKKVCQQAHSVVKARQKLQIE